MFLITVLFLLYHAIFELVVLVCGNVLVFLLELFRALQLAESEPVQNQVEAKKSPLICKKKVPKKVRIMSTFQVCEVKEKSIFEFLAGEDKKLLQE